MLLRNTHTHQKIKILRTYFNMFIKFYFYIFLIIEK